MILSLLLAHFLLAQTASTPSSIGFDENADVAALSSYRLEDWRSRALDIQFRLQGNGQSQGDVGTSVLQSVLGSSWQTRTESDRTPWSLRLDLDTSGIWRNYEDDAQGLDRSSHDYFSNFDLQSRGRHYFWRELAVEGAFASNLGYAERRAEDEQANEYSQVDRFFTGQLSAGLVVGHLRDVSPVATALRLDQRLQALGHAPLTRTQIQRIAQIVARYSGYQLVHDRAQKFFWNDVLAELGQDPSFSAFEVLYLVEALDEFTIVREEGWTVGAIYEIERNAHIDVNAWGPQLRAGYSHNLNLRHQLSADLSLEHTRREFDPGSSEVAQLALAGMHEWVVDDRIVWTNRATAYWLSSEIPGSDADRDQQDIRSSLLVFIEDHLSLTTSVSLRHEKRSQNGDEDPDYYSWGISSQLSWYFGRQLN